LARLSGICAKTGVTMSDAQTVLPNGAEIHFKDGRDDHVPDRVEFLPGGFIKAIYKDLYEIRIYHPDEIQKLATHTNHVEDAEWW